MDLALCISLKPPNITEADREALAELDDQEVLEAVSAALRQLGPLRIWDTTTMSPARIAAEPQPDLVFNLSEGMHGAGREAHAPALFEWLRWPYVGSDPVTLALTLDKWYTKCVLRSNNLPSPRGLLVHELPDDALDAFTFPAIVKPVAEGSGKGIYERCVVDTIEQARTQVEATLVRYGRPVLIEELLAGREFTVGLIGNPGRWQTLPLVEIDFAAIPQARRPIFGFEAKWLWPSPKEMVCPAVLPDNLRRVIQLTATAACDALRVRDWARVDIRLDADGVPSVLDVNPLPGILPGGGDISCFTKAAYAAGLSYEGMIHRIVETALERYDGVPFQRLGQA